MMRVVLLLLLVCLAGLCGGVEESEEGPAKSWWSGFKDRVKGVLSRWREDVKLLWDDVLTKADDMKGWTAEVFESFKRKMKEWLETRPEVPDDQKNEIETFISKLKIPTDTPRFIDP